MIQPLLLDIPTSFESERLFIRAAHLEDGPSLNEAVCESLDELKPWMIWAKNPPTLEQSMILAKQSYINYISHKDLQLLLFCKKTKQLVGSSGLHKIDWDIRKFEIGYWVRSSYANQGYITEAVKAISTFAFEQLQANRLEIRCDELNHKSAHVAEKCGFTLEGILRNDALGTDGKLRNTKVYSRIKEDI